MTLVVKDLKDTSEYDNVKVFMCGKKEVVRCDESDYHQTIDELREQGYIIIGA